MRLKKFTAFAAFVITVTSMALWITASANAQGWHRGGYPHVGYNPGRYYHGGYNRGGYFHGGVPYHGAYAYRAHGWGPGWRPGPGYARHSWAWYNSQPVYWRHAHPYYGTPGLNIFVHI